MSVNRYSVGVDGIDQNGNLVKYTDYAALEARCLELAAENAGMKSAIDATIGWQQSTDPENVESVRMLVDIKTPATEAVLAEVRAQGVEMFAAVLRRKGDDAFFDAIAEAQANAADQFAAQIRKGVLS